MDRLYRKHYAFFHSLNGSFIVISSMFASSFKMLRARSILESQTTFDASKDENGERGVEHITTDLKCNLALPKERLDNWLSIWHNYSIYAKIYYSVCLVKSTLVIACLSGFIHGYELVDCFLLGRFRYIGRTIVVGPYIFVSVCILFVLNRILMLNRSDDFNFQSLIFMLHSREQVKLAETFELHEQAANKRPSYMSGFPPRSPSLHPPLNELPLPTMLDGAPRKVNPTFFIQYPLANYSQSGCNRWILRPNRTLGCWYSSQAFSLCIMLLAFMYMVVIVILNPLIFSGYILTNIGFEVAYPVCSRHLKSIQAEAKAQNASRLPYDWVYVPSRSGIYRKAGDNIVESIAMKATNESTLLSELGYEWLPFSIPIQEWPQLSAYNLLRILADYHEVYFWNLEFGLICISMFFITNSMAVDVTLNAINIKRMLHELVMKLKSSHPNGRQHTILLERCENDKNEEEAINLLDNSRIDIKSLLVSHVLRMQTILSDHFRLVQSYSRYTTVTILLAGSIYSAQFFVYTYWMLKLSHKKFTSDFFIIQASTALWLIMLLFGSAMSRSYNMKLYASMSSAMACDWTSATTKVKWISLVKCFHPKPIYCFAIMGHFEISWLLTLKIFAWIVSVFLVVVSFHLIEHERG